MIDIPGWPRRTLNLSLGDGKRHIDGYAGASRRPPASGIGKATAFLMAREGARLLIGYFDEPGGRTAAIEGRGAARYRLFASRFHTQVTSHLLSSSSIPAPQPACLLGVSCRR